MYKCAVPPFLQEYLSKMGINGYDPQTDGFDLYKARDFARELKDFLTSQKTMEACRFCLGHLGKWQNHHQLESKFISNPNLFSITGKKDLDHNILLRECSRYYIRRLASKFHRKQMW